MCFRERQRFHQGPCLVLGLSIHQEDDAFAIAARIPLANFPVEIELYSRLNLVRNHGHDLLNGYALLGSLNDKHCGGFKYGPAGKPWPFSGCDGAMDSTESAATSKGIVYFIRFAS